MQTILVVEDDPDSRALRAACFDAERFRVVGAQSAEEASRFLRTEQFDAVVAEHKPGGSMAIVRAVTDALSLLDRRAGRR